MSNNKVGRGGAPECFIMGVRVSAINMEWLLEYLHQNMKKLSGNYITVCNVHTTVMAYENEAYRAVQNGGALTLPDGGPLSSIGRRRGFHTMQRTTGPSLMEYIFHSTPEYPYRHFFYGSTPETLSVLQVQLESKYPGINIVGMYSPPFRKLSEREDTEIVEQINAAKPDIIWVGLGAPKQENWMAQHKNRVVGLMIGVGAGFDYHAGRIQRAPEWMQRCNLEWFYRLMQDPKRLFKRYLVTNTKFIWHTVIKKC